MKFVVILILFAGFLMFCKFLTLDRLKQESVKAAVSKALGELHWLFGLAALLLLAAALGGFVYRFLIRT